MDTQVDTIDGLFEDILQISKHFIIFNVFVFKFYGFCFKVVKFSPKSVKHEDPNMVSECDDPRKLLGFSANSANNELVMIYSYSVQVLVSIC